MNTEQDLCPVCGAETDDYGRIGEHQGRHVPIDRARLEKRVKELEAKLSAVRAAYERDPWQPIGTLAEILGA